MPRLPASLVITVLIALLQIGCGSEHAETPRGDSAAVAAAAAPQLPVLRSDTLVDLTPMFEGLGGCFVLLDDSTGHLLRYNAERCATGMLPASTFKIPNSLIALETGVAPDTSFTLQWDSTVAPRVPGRDNWAQDHTLGSAFRNSVVWYYREIARRVGAERMQRYLDSFDYGNRSMAGGLDRFWLDGEIRISADQQVAFLQRFYHNRLGLRQSTVDAVRGIMLADTTGGVRIGQKTGTAELGEDHNLAWLVGYVERGGRNWFFALNIEGKVDQIWDRPKRGEKVRQILRQFGIVPS